jgi:hypothetical protein
MALGTTVRAKGLSERHDSEDGLVVTFTKWFPDPASLSMAGVVGGAVGHCTFAGQVIELRDYAPDFPFTQLDAIYHVQAGAYSFTALIHGRVSDTTGRGTLDGAILDGWLTGAEVHVQFDTLASCSEHHAGPCFRGTIRIRRGESER